MSHRVRAREECSVCRTLVRYDFKRGLLGQAKDLARCRPIWNKGRIGRGSLGLDHAVPVQVA